MAYELKIAREGVKSRIRQFADFGVVRIGARVAGPHRIS
jgi:hypothetical protein